MRKGRLLVGALVLAIVAASSGVALGSRSVVQTLVGEISPAKLPKTQFRNTGLRIVTELRDSEDSAECSSVDPPEACIRPPAASASNIDFDDDIRFNPGSVSRCDPQAVAGKTSADARAICPKSIVGGGLVVARGGVVGEQASPDLIKTNATLFNGTQDSQGRPRLILHGDAAGLGAVSLIGTLVDSPLGSDFGKRLTLLVPIPIISSTRVDLSVRRGLYVQARCRDADRRLNFSGLFTFSARGGSPGEPLYPASADASSASACTLDPAPYRPCVTRANRARKRAVNRAKRRLTGKRRARAIRAANKRRKAAVRRCARLHLG